MPSSAQICAPSWPSIKIISGFFFISHIDISDTKIEILKLLFQGLVVFILFSFTHVCVCVCRFSHICENAFESMCENTCMYVQMHVEA